MRLLAHHAVLASRKQRQEFEASASHVTLDCKKGKDKVRRLKDIREGTGQDMSNTMLKFRGTWECY